MMSSFIHELKVGAFIAKGHFGDVHEGIDPVHGKVAVKVLRQSPEESVSEWEQRQETLLGEAQNLRAAEHDNVVRVHTLIRANVDNKLHMVVEYCEGGSLLTTHQNGPMPLHGVKSILTDICSGLGFIHSKGMIHRDIKPGNILINRNRFKLGDFGLVSNSLIGGYASAAGYCDHLAPEVHLNRLTSTQTDIWALGMTIYRLLHGHPFYFENFKTADIPASIIKGGFARRLPWLPHIPISWRKFVCKAMHDDARKRYQSAFQMSQAAAPLLVTPDWNCSYSSTKTTWKRQKGSRQIGVIMKTVDADEYIWHAISEGGERSRKLGGNDVPMSRALTLLDLEKFFANSN